MKTPAQQLSMEPFNDADRWTLANLSDTFHTNGGDSTLAHRDGQKFTLLGRTPDGEYDRVEPEAGSLWKIRFEDGFETSAFGDEIAREK